MSGRGGPHTQRGLWTHDQAASDISHACRRGTRRGVQAQRWHGYTRHTYDTPPPHTHAHTHALPTRITPHQAHAPLRNLLYPSLQALRQQLPGKLHLKHTAAATTVILGAMLCKSQDRMGALRLAVSCKSLPNVTVARTVSHTTMLTRGMPHRCRIYVCPWALHNGITFSPERAAEA